MSLQIAANCSLLFTELPLLERPAAAAGAGFEGIEMWWPFATATSTKPQVDDLVDAIGSSGLPLVGLNFFAGDMANGDRGLASWTGRETEFQDNVDVITDIARRLGTHSFNALYGNALDGVQSQVQEETAMTNLEYAADALGTVAGQVLLEPVSGAPRYPLRTAAEVIAVIETFEARSSQRNVSFLADLYHLTINGDDVIAALERYAKRVGHVQIADAPGRHEPGSGLIDFAHIRQTLSHIGYDSWVAAEYIPSAATLDGLSWLSEWS